MLHTVSDLDLRLLRVFLAIVDAGGVSAAQASLGVGQSTLSSQLSTLETRLGFSLCERGRGGFRLTAKGRRFVDLARAALQGLEGFSAQARNMHRQLVGSLAIGLIGNAPTEYNALMGRAIQRFRQRDEAVRLSVLVRGPRELEEMLLRDELQVAVGYFLHRARELDPSVPEERFRYRGPTPRSRETAILMLADGCEAALRSLPPDTSEAEARAMVTRLVSAIPFQLSQPVDLITCFLYSLHYSQTIAGLTACIRQAHLALNPGGVFCFNAVDKHKIDNNSLVRHHASGQWEIYREDGLPMPADEFPSVRALKHKVAVNDVTMQVVAGDHRADVVARHAGAFQLLVEHILFFEAPARPAIFLRPGRREPALGA